MDQQSLIRYRSFLKEQRAAVHLRLDILKHEGRSLGGSEVKDEADRGRDSVANQFSAVRQSQAQVLLEDINAALDRIDAGRFGECANCSQQISTKRLIAVPWAKYCITCQELIDGC
jgi:DnaK suppressor protein